MMGPCSEDEEERTMRKVLVLGAGLVTKPMIDYYLDTCGYEVVLASRTVSKCERMIAGRPDGKAVTLLAEDADFLEGLIREADLVVCLIPRNFHMQVADLCIENRKNMITTDFETPEMRELDERVRAADLLILNEIGEDPGLDHMGAVEAIDAVKAEGGRVTALASYGSGIPSREANTNPFGYKFSWSPHGLIMSAKMTAAYLREGKTVEVPQIFDHHWLVDVEGLGTFEAYPNRDCRGYVEKFGLDPDVSIYRGLLRYVGYCNTMLNLKKLGLLETGEEESFAGKTNAGLVAELIGAEGPAGLKQRVAERLGLKLNDDVMERLDWLGLFRDDPIAIERGIKSDVLVDLMVKKLSYRPGERDWIIVHNEVTAEFSDRRELRSATMAVEGIPNGDSAMSRAVALPTAIAGRLILEGKIEARGVIMPTLREIYQPVLTEMKTFGFEFVKRVQPLGTS
jgi:saccharopine dehydrogenase-like NADP-dependent oxidoreductase